MQVKYFLSEFTIDIEQQEQSCSKLIKDIKVYLDGLRAQAGIMEKNKANKK